METSKGIRKRVHHDNTPFDVHELTFSCYQRRPLLAMTNTYGLFAESLSRAVERHEFDLLAFVFMPEHVHLMVKCRNAEYSMSDLLFAIKRPFSFRVRQLLEAARDPLATELVVRERPGVTCFRFWQEGPGYDRNLASGDALINSLRYIHRNPVRRGLFANARDWRWSSFLQYLEPDQEPAEGLPRIRRLRV